MRILFRVMHGKKKGEGRAHGLLSTTTQTAVLNLTSKQFTDDRLARGALGTTTQMCTRLNLKEMYKQHVNAISFDPSCHSDLLAPL